MRGMQQPEMAEEDVEMGRCIDDHGDDDDAADVDEKK